MIESALIGGLNHLLGQADWATAHLIPFAGRAALFTLAPWQLGFSIAADGLLEPAAANDPDVTIALPADAPLLVMQGVERLFAAAHVTGNAQFATALSFVFRNLRWDAEEDVSRLVGDIAAHRIVAGVGALAIWQRRAARHMGENLAEYASHETGLVIGKTDLETFRRELASLDEDIGRLERRCLRLSGRPSG